MPWRGLHVSQAAKLSLTERQIVVQRDGGEVRVPLEDVAWIVLDTQMATLTTALLSACMEAGVVLIQTDARHLPSGLILPFHRHHRQAVVAQLQTQASAALRKRLWQRIVQAKIANQAEHLARRRGSAAPLPEMARLVASATPEMWRHGPRGNIGGGCFPASPAVTARTCAILCWTTATRWCAAAWRAVAWQLAYCRALVCIITVPPTRSILPMISSSRFARSSIRGYST